MADGSLAAASTAGGGLGGVVLKWVQHGSVRSFGKCLAESVGLRIAPSSLAERLKAAEGAYKAWRSQPLEDVPPVVVVDGIHFTVGNGPGRRGEKVCGVVAVGLWPERGEVKILDFELGKAEDEQTAARLFSRLEERGLEKPLLVISDDNGAFRAAAEAVWGEVAWQLCLNHKLRAARRHVPAGMKKQFTAEAGEVFAASSREEAVRRANELCKRWWPRARGGVQSLMRNFGLALSFCGFPTSWHEAIRTNNVAEAAMRTFRDALRRAGGSPCSTHGALAILLAQAIHFNDYKNP